MNIVKKVLVAAVAAPLLLGSSVALATPAFAGQVCTVMPNGDTLCMDDGSGGVAPGDGGTVGGGGGNNNYAPAPAPAPPKPAPAPAPAPKPAPAPVYVAPAPPPAPAPAPRPVAPAPAPVYVAPAPVAPAPQPVAPRPAAPAPAPVAPAPAAPAPASNAVSGQDVSSKAKASSPDTSVSKEVKASTPAAKKDESAAKATKAATPEKSKKAVADDKRAEDSKESDDVSVSTSDSDNSVPHVSNATEVSTELSTPELEFAGFNSEISKGVSDAVTMSSLLASVLAIGLLLNHIRQRRSFANHVVVDSTLEQ